MTVVFYFIRLERERRVFQPFFAAADLLRLVLRFRLCRLLELLRRVLELLRRVRRLRETCAPLNSPLFSLRSQKFAVRFL